MFEAKRIKLGKAIAISSLTNGIKPLFGAAFFQPPIKPLDDKLVKIYILFKDIATIRLKIKLNNNMKHILLLAVFALAATQVNAQKVVYMDMTKVLESLPEYEQAQKQLEEVAETWRQEIADEYQQIEKMYADYQANEVLMSDEMRQQKQDEIIEKEKQVRDMQKAKFGPEGALFEKRQELVQPIQERVYDVVSDYAKDTRTDFILDQGSTNVIYANPDLDKTQEIIDRLQKK